MADYWKALLGGTLIGAGTAALLLLNGKIAGISGMLANSLRGGFGASGWRVAFLLGLVLPAAVLGLGRIEFAQNLPVLAAAGLLVGLGTRLGNGCTSGHGVCGLSNLSWRSFLATLTFMSVAAGTVFLMRHAGFAWRS